MHNKRFARSMPGWLLLAVCFLALLWAVTPFVAPKEADVYQAAAHTVQAEPIPVQTGMVPVNLADEALLCTLPGIGPATARAIIEEREVHGPFFYPENLLHVKGIGPAVLEKIRPHLDLTAEE